jgi:hypothetical protein
MGEEADVPPLGEVSVDIAPFPVNGNDQLSPNELRLWFFSELGSIQSGDANWILTFLPIVWSYYQEVMLKGVPEARQISLGEVFRRFWIAMPRFQSPTAKRKNGQTITMT